MAVKQVALIVDAGDATGGAIARRFARSRRALRANSGRSASMWRTS